MNTELEVQPRVQLGLPGANLLLGQLKGDCTESGWTRHRLPVNKNAPQASRENSTLLQSEGRGRYLINVFQSIRQAPCTEYCLASDSTHVFRPLAVRSRIFMTAGLEFLMIFPHKPYPFFLFAPVFWKVSFGVLIWPVTVQFNTISLYFDLICMNCFIHNYCFSLLM